MGGKILGRENQKFSHRHISIEMHAGYPCVWANSATGYLYWSPVKGLGLRQNFMNHWHLGNHLRA